MQTAWQIAVVGAGPVGLATALHAAQLLPHAQITLFDARPADADASADPRTLALALGSVQFLQRLQTWPAQAAEPITAVHVSQVPPSPGLFGFAEPEVLLRADELGVPQLGAVLSYGALVPALQAAWVQQQAQEPQRLNSRFGTPVADLRTLADGVELRVEPNGAAAERFDLAVVAEGGVFAQQMSKPVVRDYGQTAWVGRVSLAGATPGMAFERFTRHGPAALLPLPRTADGPSQAALVWCVPQNDDPVRDLSDAQRMAVLNTVFPRQAGRIVGIGPLKDFALGLNAERALVGRQGSGWPRVRGRVVRIGNAAQTLHPVAGQGLNLGLRDAHALVDALRWSDDLDAALARVDWARAPDRWSTIATTDFLARSFTWRWPGAAAARGVGLAALQAMPPLKGWLARQMMFGRR